MKLASDTKVSHLLLFCLVIPAGLETVHCVLYGICRFYGKQTAVIFDLMSAQVSSASRKELLAFGINLPGHLWMSLSTCLNTKANKISCISTSWFSLPPVIWGHKHLQTFDRLIMIQKDGWQNEEASLGMTEIHSEAVTHGRAKITKKKSNSGITRRKSFWVYWQGSDYVVSKKVMRWETKTRSLIEFNAERRKDTLEETRREVFN